MLREELRAALGDRSCLEDLRLRLRSLDDNCLTGLEHALDAAAQGDLTVDVHPVTRLMEAGVGQRVGELAEIFNWMLAKAQSGITSYNAMRGGLGNRVGAMVEEIGTLAGRVASSSQEMTANSVDEIARQGVALTARITDIADRTHRRALNAAIRGGPRQRPGRGFAVVAGEVKKLAESAAETAARARDAFHGLAHSIESVHTLVDRVVQATDQAAEVAVETSAATEEVSASAQRSAASPQEIASSSQQLAEMAGALERLAGRIHHLTAARRLDSHRLD